MPDLITAFENSRTYARAIMDKKHIKITDEGFNKLGADDGKRILRILPAYGQGRGNDVLPQHGSGSGAALPLMPEIIRNGEKTQPAGFRIQTTLDNQQPPLGGGGPCAFFLSRGNAGDRNPAVINRMCQDLRGKLFGDRGYISQELFERLYRQGIKLITRLKKNMKNKLAGMEDKLLLRKRAVIESVNDFLKNICQVENTRHRSLANFLVNLFGRFQPAVACRINRLFPAFMII
jgi:hypothetical protein